MTNTKLLDRIIVNPKIKSGKPVIRGTRLLAAFILRLLAHGKTFDEIIQEYKGLTAEDIQACLLFASKTLETIEFEKLDTETEYLFFG